MQTNRPDGNPSSRPTNAMVPNGAPTSCPTDWRGDGEWTTLQPSSGHPLQRFAAIDAAASQPIGGLGDR